MNNDCMAIRPFSCLTASLLTKLGHKKREAILTSLTDSLESSLTALNLCLDQSDHPFLFV
jgi:hypothetical protein